MQKGCETSGVGVSPSSLWYIRMVPILYTDTQGSPLDTNGLHDKQRNEKEEYIAIAN